MDKKDPEYVQKRTQWGSGPHTNKKVDERKGLVRKLKYKQPVEPE